MQRSQKPQVISNLKDTFAASSIVIVTSQTGLTVDQSNALRNKVREAGASFKITKNTLARIAAKEAGCNDLITLFTGPTGTATGNDPVATAKAISDFSNDNDKLQVVGGLMDGKILSAAQVHALAKLPSLDQLRGILIGLIQAPATKIAGITQAPAAQLARVFAAYARKDA